MNDIPIIIKEKPIYHLTIFSTSERENSANKGRANGIISLNPFNIISIATMKTKLISITYPCHGIPNSTNSFPRNKKLGSQLTSLPDSSLS